MIRILNQKTCHILLSSILLFTLQAVGKVEDPDSNKFQTSKITSLDAKLIDINNIGCYINNNGEFGPKAGSYDGFWYPKGFKNPTILFDAGFWTVGKVGNEIRSAVACFGSSFQPGIILPNGKPDDPNLSKYQVYIYNKGDNIDSEAIAQGCLDTVLGDQMLFSVFNDVQVGIEVQHTAFAFEFPGALGNTLFFKYQVTNKGDENLDSAYFAIWADADLGNHNDDYFGCDTVLDIVYVYNGDSWDDRYGQNVPALGCDVLQGPIVDSPGDTVFLPDGTIYYDKKMLTMTSNFSYRRNGGPGEDDPRSPQGCFYYVKGFQQNGEPWLDPTQGNIPTPFPFYGDPFEKTGWIMADYYYPTDVRIGISSGPFQLDVNESQDFMVALVVGRAGDPLSSVKMMKLNDQYVQDVFDNNFLVPSLPPRPNVAVAELDGEVMLTWDDAAVGFERAGYAFEGYNVYQGESESGPWTRIATYDLKNEIRRIRDWIYNEAANEMVEQTVQFGTDSGLSYKFHVERDYLEDRPLINGTPYYFTVTTYAYNLNGVPKSLENDKRAIEAIPQRPILDIKYNSEIGDEIPVSHEGPSYGQVIIKVIDPTAITGDDYEVTFFIEDDSTSLNNSQK